MVVRRRPEPQGTLPTVTPQQGLQLLSAQLEKARALLKARPLSDVDFEKWQTVAHNYLVQAFGSASENVSRVMDEGGYSIPYEADEEWWEDRRADRLSSMAGQLEALIEVLHTEISLATPPRAEASLPISTSRVFLVHGRDQGALQETARFLEHLGLQPIVLQEQPNEGRTIIQKFLDYSDVGFAVVLLTPDDRGGSADEPPDNYNLRARQNAILELGYFLRALGPKHVCALYFEGVELPSDIQGVLYVVFDKAGGWKFLLAREMKAAGLSVDLNRLR